MLESISHFIETVLLPLGGFGVFLGSFIEELIVFIPSSAVQLGSGFLLLGDSPISPQSLLYLLVTIAIPCSLGITLGSLFTYAIGYYGGPVGIQKFGKYIGVKWQDVERLHVRFKKTYSDEWSLVTLRVIPVIPAVLINVLAGLIRMRLPKYMLLTFLSSVPRVFIVAFFGWQTAFLYTQYFSYAEDVGYVLIAGAIIFVLYKLRHRIKRAYGSRNV